MKINRQIKFRGRSIYNGEWLYGDLVHSADKKRRAILVSCCDNYEECEVEFDTVGQFTGLYDKNGKEIYEGDVVRNKYGDIGRIFMYKGSFMAAWKDEETNNIYSEIEIVGAETARIIRKENGHEYVDIGLSVKWATCNIGADIPSDHGDYFSWGDTQPKSRYDWDNCFDFHDDIGRWDIYNSDGQTRIAPTSGHDTSRENWGGMWRMPTISEFEELSSKCRWTWTSIDGHNGYTVTGPNGNSIFLPAAGFRFDVESCRVGRVGIYWSNALSHNYSFLASSIFFNLSYYSKNVSSRCVGQSVRPVID